MQQVKCLVQPQTSLKGFQPVTLFEIRAQALLGHAVTLSHLDDSLVDLGIGHGHVDFAGSSVVHMQGGVIALVFAWLLGARYGKYNKDGSINALPAHNVPLVILGTFILAFCWFSFNAGSSLAGTDFRIGVAATNTMLASATAAMATTLYMWWFKTKKPDPTMMCNGMLAGLVAITAPCAFVDSIGACIIGLVSGILVVESVFFWDKRGIDDPVGAISSHGVAGVWGVMAAGIFANRDGVRGALHCGWELLGTQALGGVALAVLAFGISWVFFKVAGKFLPMRVPPEVELEGLDLSETGVIGYPEFQHANAYGSGFSFGASPRK